MEVIILLLLPVIGLFLYGFNSWINKVELEREYLQSLLKDQEKDKNILRKGR